MPGRLIDADELIKTPEVVAKKKARSDAQQALMGRIFYIIDHKPTAYDVDNVLCQINDILCDEIDQPVADCVAEAVRGGGIDA